MENAKFADFAESYRVGNDTEKENAAGAVIDCLDKLIKRIAAGLCGGKEELYNTGVVAVLQELPNYTEEKGDPEAFFGPVVKRSMIEYIARVTFYSMQHTYGKP